MNDLERADTGDILVRDGVEWRVTGHYNKPCILLARADVPWPNPVSNRTDVAVIPQSDSASEWSFPKPSASPVVLKARELVAERYVGPDCENLIVATLAGEDDDTVPVRNAIKAIRVGMALAKEAGQQAQYPQPRA